MSTIDMNQTIDEKSEQNSKVLIGNPGSGVKIKKRSTPVEENDGSSKTVVNNDESTIAEVENAETPQFQHQGKSPTMKGELALGFAEKGFHVIPLHPGTDVPMTENGVDDATKDVEIVEDWWKKSPNANIGLACGKAAKLMAIEVHYRNNADGDRTFETIEKSYGAIDTFTIATPGGGWCLCFNAPEKDALTTEYLLPGVDVLFEGKIVVAPPSDVDGVQYTWSNNIPPKNLPPKLATMLHRVTHNRAKGNSQDEAVKVSEPQIEKKHEARPVQAEEPRHKGWTIAEAAVWYAEKGHSIFPLRPGTKVPLTPNGVKDATNDVETVRGWWMKNPNANIGFPCGTISNCVVLDIDIKNDAKGMESLQRLGETYGPFDTMTVSTPSGGLHLYFKMSSEPLWNGVNVYPGIDIRTTNGYVILPPSQIDGVQYTWSNKGRLVEMPDGLLKDILSQRNNSKMRSPGGHNTQVGNALKGTKEGGRNDLVFRLACKIRQEGIPYEQAAVLVKQAAANCSPPLPEAEAERCLNSAFSYDPGPGYLTEFGNAERLVNRHGDNLRYVPELKTWYRWNGVFWEPDTTGTIYRLGKETVRGIRDEITTDMDEDTKSAIRAHANRSESKGKLQAMIDLAAHEPGIAVRQSDLDRDDLLLGVRNGTVDLRTGKFREGQRDDLMTKQTGGSFDITAQAPQWSTFLATTFDGSQELLAYIQRVVGYLLTGNVSERVLFLLFGSGANGKSTFLEVLRALLADYAIQTPAETLMASGRGGGGIPNDIARLSGARFVAASETEEGHRLAESTIKHLTGGDTLTARFLFREFFEFRPTFKVLMATNYRPEIRGTDPAIWNRLHLIPFAVAIPKEQQNRRLRDKLLTELPGILNWAIRGCLDWQRQGLQPPTEVLHATEDYRSDQNLVAIWADERCERQGSARAQASVLYRDFRAWVEQQGEKPMTQRRFGERLAALGFEKTKANTYYYVGLTFKAACVSGNSVEVDLDPNSVPL